MASTLTRRGAITRARIVDGAAEEIREHGVSVTLDDVLARTRTSKGQLFHYFPGGREQLLLAVAEREAARVLEDQQPFLGELVGWESWNAWRDVVVERYRRQGVHCPLATVMTEVGRSTPAARAVTTALILEWERNVGDGVRRMRDAGLVDHAIDAAAFARALIAGIQGGVAIMLATGRLDYLEAAIDTQIAALRRHAVAVGPGGISTGEIGPGGINRRADRAG